MDGFSISPGDPLVGGVIEVGQVLQKSVLDDIDHFPAVDGGGDFEALVERGVEIEGGLLFWDEALYR